ncbi:hypothetical protein Acid7E03_10180 [Acidisoma sp. 7E03]
MVAAAPAVAPVSRPRRRRADVERLARSAETASRSFSSVMEGSPNRAAPVMPGGPIIVIVVSWLGPRHTRAGRRARPYLNRPFFTVNGLTYGKARSNAFFRKIPVPGENSTKDLEKDK